MEMQTTELIASLPDVQDRLLRLPSPPPQMRDTDMSIDDDAAEIYLLDSMGIKNER